MTIKNVLVQDLEDAGGGVDLSVPGAPAALQPKSPMSPVVNWANDKAVRDRLKAEIFPLLDVIRGRRAPLEEVWNSCHMMYNMQHEEQMYEGRANLFIPAGKKTIDTLTFQTVAATFPTDDNFTAEARSGQSDQQVQLVKGALRERVDSTARVRQFAELYYRQLYITGSSPVKIFYSKKVLKGVTARTRDAERPIAFGSKEVTLQDTPVFSVRNVEHVYFFPENVASAEECEIIFEDMSVSHRDMVYRAKRGEYSAEAVEAAKGARGARQQQNEQRTLESQGMNVVAETPGWETTGITEVWFDWDPKNDGECVPFRAVFTANGECLRATANPFWHQRKPYVLGTVGNKVGRLYGIGTGETILQLNKLLNDQTNQAMDCATYTLNPVAIIDPNKIVGRMPGMQPGVVIKTLDINGAFKFERPPQELIQYGSMLTNGTMQMINEFSGAPPVLQGLSMPGRAFKTASGVANAQKNASVPMQEVVRLSEKQVWEPMLYMFWALDQQFADDHLLARLTDGKTDRASPESVAGDWDFRWLASTQASNAAVKAQQMIDMLQVATNPQVTQALAMEGKRFNVSHVIQRLYIEGMGFRDISSLILDGAPMMPGAPGAAPGAVPPTPSGVEDGQPEEAQGDPSFGEVRSEADALAAMLGAGNAPGLT